MIAQLEANPKDASIATKIGNLYDDAKMYPKAIQYYEKSVKLSPENPDVLTDLGTAYFYNGNPDQALKDFDRALKVRPNYAQTLFNMGIVKWQGKNDIKGAVASLEPVAADESGLSREAESSGTADTGASAGNSVVVSC